MNLGGEMACYEAICTFSKRLLQATQAGRSPGDDVRSQCIFGCCLLK